MSQYISNYHQYKWIDLLKIQLYKDDTGKQDQGEY